MNLPAIGVASIRKRSICPATEDARLSDDDVAKSRSRARARLRISDADSRGYLLETGESQFLVGRVSIRVYFKIRNTYTDKRESKESRA